MTGNDDEIQKFFNFIERGNIDDIISIIKDLTKKPWDYVEEENYTGINKL